MTATTPQLFEQMGLSLALGLLVGLQRQHSKSLIAGVRTFPFISLLGTLTASLDQQSQSNGWVLGSGFVCVTVLVALAAWRTRQLDRDDSYGMTTEMAALMIFAVGAYLVLGNRIVAVAVGAVVAVLLQFKSELHGLAVRLGNEDLRAIMTFALITCVILPVLPNRSYDVASPLDVFNPFETWLMVVLMVGISLGGYLAYKFFGHRAGLLLGGILGGAISSTATTLSYARRSQASPQSCPLAALVVLIASSVVYVRVITEVAVVAPSQAAELVPPVLMLLGAMMLVSCFAWLRVRGMTSAMPEHKNPTELRSAIVFGLMYTVVLMALSLAKSHFDESGVLAVAAVSGLTDMDAITLSTARMVALGPDAGGLEPRDGWCAIVIASLSNLVFKALIALIAGGWRLFCRVSLMFMAPFAVGVAMLLCWP